MEFLNYFKNVFQQDLENFTTQIPPESKYVLPNEVAIQYSTLTPQYNYLNAVPENRKLSFATALFWIVLIDQIYHYKYSDVAIDNYESFHARTKFPKFIADKPKDNNLTYRHLHPSKIFEAIPWARREDFQESLDYSCDGIKSELKLLLTEKQRFNSLWNKLLQHLPLSEQHKTYIEGKGSHFSYIHLWKGFEYVHIYTLLNDSREEEDAAIEEFYEKLKGNEGHYSANALFQIKNEKYGIAYRGSIKLLKLTGVFHPTAKLTNVFHRNDPQLKTLRSIFFDRAGSRTGGRCGPVYREAVVFFDKNDRILNVLHICLSCTSLSWNHRGTTKVSIDEDLAKKFFVSIGHQERL